MRSPDLELAHGLVQAASQKAVTALRIPLGDSAKIAPKEVTTMAQKLAPAHSPAPKNPMPAVPNPRYPQGDTRHAEIQYTAAKDKPCNSPQ